MIAPIHPRSVAFVASLMLVMIAAAQQKDAPTRLKISGSVLELGTSQPIADAEVKLNFYGPERPRMFPLPAVATLTAASDVSGAFSFDLDSAGYYDLRAAKTGYEAASGGMVSSSSFFAVSKEAPAYETRLVLTRKGTITGHAVDDDTGQPLANVRLLRWPARVVINGARGTGMMYGRPSFGEGSAAVTGSDGGFQLAAVPREEYVIQVNPTRGSDRVLTKFTDADAGLVEHDFEQTYWPGGHGPEAATPVSLTSDSSLDIGTLRIRKVPFYRVRVKVSAATCGPNDTVMAYEASPGYQLELARDVPCGRDLLLTGFQPGAYRLILAVNGRERATRETASIPFVIRDENITINAPLTRGINLTGAFVAAEGTQAPDFAKLQLSLRALDTVPFADLSTPAPAGAEGKFEIAAIPPVNCVYSIVGLGPAFYVKEVSHNGHPLAGVIPLEAPAATQSLKIVISDKAAAITGSVMSGDKPVPNALIVARKWPPAEMDPSVASSGFSYGRSQARSDQQGRFQIAGLAPGEYRAIAVRVVTSPDFTAIDRALASTEKIEIGPAFSTNLSLQVKDLQ
jgi:hypothetical protein